MIKLSAVIITYNEEKKIERCIQSLVEIADEIIIVDSVLLIKLKRFVRHIMLNLLNNLF